MINLILREEKMKEREVEDLVKQENEELEKNKEKGDKICLRNIEEQTLKTQKNIDKLVSIISKFESDISDMHL